MWYCASCGKVICRGHFAISVHGKLFCSDACEAVYESRDVAKVIEANLDNDGGRRVTCLSSGGKTRTGLSAESS
jgi:hypothetical protein